MSSPTVLLTGATNQIGFYLLPLLLEEHEVIVMSRQPVQTQHPKLHCWQKDLNNLNNELQLDTVTTLFHLAPLLFLPDLLAHLPKVQRVIAFSSTSRFSKVDSSNAEERLLVDRLIAGEAALKDICQQRAIAYTLFRPTLVYGCARDKNVFFIAQQIRRFGFFPLTGSGCGLRQPVHAQDLALACLQAWHEKQTFNRAYNLSGGQTLPYAQMVEIIFRRLDRSPRLLKIPVWMLRVAVFFLRYLPPFRTVSVSMIERMNSDLCFDHSPATADFGYQPRSFAPDPHALHHRHTK